MGYFQDLSLATVLVRVLLAMILGCIIGMEREMKQQPAGFRTYTLVCVGSAVVMMTNEFLMLKYGAGDPARLGAQVISGIGFLGAGTIIVTRNSHVRGLTTAAGLWTAACMGLAIGVGFYEVAFVTGGAIFLIMALFQKVDKRLMQESRIMHIYAIFDSISSLWTFTSFCRENGLHIFDLELNKEQGDDENEIVATFMLENKRRMHRSEVISFVSQVEGLEHIEELR